MPKIAILDDLVVAESLAFTLGATQAIESAGAASTLGDLEQLIVRDSPDVILADIAVDNAAERLLVCDLPEVRARELPILFLSRDDHLALMEAAQRHGAAGFLLKSTPVETLASAIAIVASGGTVFDAHMKPPSHHGDHAPTERELELLQTLSRGLTNVAVAHDLNISPRTVESHLRRLFTRYDVSSRSQLLMLAIREGWISANDTLPESDDASGSQSA